MTFYHYSQNNSGGSFTYNESAGISVHVIIEADSPDQADQIAESIGLYFDGYYDCSCCGNRWHPASSYDASEVPQVYGDEVKPGDHFVDKQYLSKWIDNGFEGFIHYSNGQKEGFWYAPIEVIESSQVFKAICQ